MKNKLTILITAILLASCSKGVDNKDVYVNAVLKTETEHLDNYLKIYKATEDKEVKKIIDSIKTAKKEESIEARGFLEGSKGFWFGDMEEPLSILEEYDKKLKDE